MAKRLHIDIESYSECDLTKCGVYRYAEDKTTEILILCYALTDGKALVTRGRVYPDGDGLDEFLELYADEAIELAAHNAQFERVMLATRAGRAFGIGYVPDYDRWICTAAKAATWGLPRSLDGAAAALDVIRKDESGSAIMRKICRPKRPTKKDPALRYTAADHPEMFDALYAYCDNDVDVEIAIDHMLPDMNSAEKELYVRDQIINDRGIAVDLKLVNRVIELYKIHEDRLESESAKIAGVSVRQVQESISWLATRGVVVESLDSEAVDAALKLDLAPDARRFLEIREELSRASIGKYDAIARSVNGDGRVRGMFLFYGAGTGRWSGRLVQLQNLPRGYFSDIDNALSCYFEPDSETALELLTAAYGSVTAAFSTTIRSCFIPGDGMEIGQCDYASIEARVLGWLAGDENYQDAFRKNLDLYKVTAAHIFGVEYDNVTKDQRQLGKQAVLGLGYQMGLEKFITTCEKQGVIAPRELYEKAHEGYRRLYNGITRYWRALNAAAMEVVAVGGTASVGGGNRRVIFSIRRVPKTGNVWLVCKLPSGRELAYFRPRIVDGKFGQQVEYMSLNSMTKKFEYTNCYGGKWCENIVQAVARDLLRDSLPHVEAAGFTVVGHVHDELITTFPAGTKTKAELEKAMTTLPRWASGCIVGAEGDVMKRYKK